MKKIKIGKSKILCALIGIVMTFSCSYRDGDHDTVFGSKVIITETRNVDYFHSIEIVGGCDVFFTKDVSQKLILEGEHNILPIIRTWVRHDGILVIEPERSYKTDVGLRAYVSMTEIRGFTIAGSGTIVGELPFETNELTLKIAGSGQIRMDVVAQNVFSEIAGSGDIFLVGNTGFHRNKIAGSGNLNASGFVTAKYEIRIAGSGDCYIHVRDMLDVVIAGSGNIYYRGNPAVINCTIIGSGKLIKSD
ncbi:MAG: DUF2807 domain-containing protein [Candidatus Aminicenantes bacterium]|nr:MAG: DUF2807 domain-containing protein [Candidatus Aminicenantes bacterium]